MAIAVASLPIAAGLAVATGTLGAEFEQAPRMLAGGSVVVLVTLYGHEQGARVGPALRRAGAGSIERGRSLAASAIEAVDAAGQVTVRPDESIHAIPGYPPLPDDLAAEIEDEAWRLPADLPLSELAARIERRLRLAYDLEAVEVTVDPRGTATIAAATPVSAIRSLRSPSNSRNRPAAARRATPRSS